jgi:hypothetical protein
MIGQRRVPVRPRNRPGEVATDASAARRMLNRDVRGGVQAVIGFDQAGGRGARSMRMLLRDR